MSAYLLVLIWLAIASVGFGLGLAGVAATKRRLSDSTEVRELHAEFPVVAS